MPPLLLQPLVENAVTHGIAHVLEGARCGSAAESGRQGCDAVDNPCDPDRRPDAAPAWACATSASGSRAVWDRSGAAYRRSRRPLHGQARPADRSDRTCGMNRDNTTDVFAIRSHSIQAQLTGTGAPGEATAPQESPLVTNDSRHGAKAPGRRLPVPWLRRARLRRASRRSREATNTSGAADHAPLVFVASGDLLPREARRRRRQ